MQGAPAALPVNVDTTGAQILDGDGLSGPDQRDSRDIWLPNWVETVSHIAVDVSFESDYVQPICIPPLLLIHVHHLLTYITRLEAHWQR